MFIQVTGLDGSGTSSIAERLKNKSDNAVVLKTPSNEYEGRKIIDTVVRQDSKVANMLYYLSSTVYMSDYIKNHYDLKETDVYVVRYLIDTVVSNRGAGIPIDLNYNIYGNNLLVPDLTLFIYTDEEIRQNRITNRGKSELDKVLDNNSKRLRFLEEFKKLLIMEKTIIVDNSSTNFNETIEKTYSKILEYKRNI